MGPLEIAIKNFESYAQYYDRDLAALTEETILSSAGGVARKPVDFTYELGLINRRIAAQIRGDEPPAMPEGDDWIVAPAEFRSKEGVAAYMRSASDELLAAARAIPAEDSNRLIGTGDRQQPVYSRINFAGMHIMYHTAQLNYIQCLHGDNEMHWM